jgi:hypothetical protein
MRTLKIVVIVIASIALILFVLSLLIFRLLAFMNFANTPEQQRLNDLTAEVCGDNNDGNYTYSTPPEIDYDLPVNNFNIEILLEEVNEDRVEDIAPVFSIDRFLECEFSADYQVFIYDKNQSLLTEFEYTSSLRLRSSPEDSPRVYDVSESDIAEFVNRLEGLYSFYKGSDFEKIKLSDRFYLYDRGIDGYFSSPFVVGRFPYGGKTDSFHDNFDSKDLYIKTINVSSTAQEARSSFVNYDIIDTGKVNLNGQFIYFFDFKEEAIPKRSGDRREVKGDGVARVFYRQCSQNQDQLCPVFNQDPLINQISLID